MKHYIIPIFVPHLGCPHDCVFCDQSKITNLERVESSRISGKDVERTVDEYLKTIDRTDATVEISFFGGTFTAIPKWIQADLLKSAKKYKDMGVISHIRCSTRPDYIDNEILEFVTSYGMDIIEIGVQSLDEEVLLKSGRGHDDKSVEIASKLIKSHGLTLGHQIMLGLPGDTFNKDIETTRKSIAMKPDIVRIYPALVIKETAMEKLLKDGTYKPYELEEAVIIAAKIIDMYEEAGVKVIRNGLQATDEISPKKGMIEGPYHPAFNELTKSYRFWSKLENNLKSIIDNKSKNMEIILKVNPKDVSVLYADKKKYFKKFLSDTETTYGKEQKEFKLRVIQDTLTLRGNVTISIMDYNFEMSI